MSPVAQRHARVLSGMRPTGRLHLGHYQGVLKSWLRLQHEYQCFFFVADWHALTTHYDDPTLIPESTWDMVVDWLAAGIDPGAATLFIQSRVPEHAELHLLLSMITPLGWLERVPSYKDQQENLRDKDLATYGFLGYPLLQSADILMYKAALVPVGEDQVAHVELTREIARRFNHIYGGGRVILPEPRPLLTAASRMPGLDGRKMSKSYGNTIALRDDLDRVEKALRTMPTDPARVRRSDPGDPQKCPVWQFHEVYCDDQVKQWVQAGCRSAGIGCIECKQTVIDAVRAELGPIQERAKALEADPERVRHLIARGCEAARAVARETMAEVRHAMSLVSR